MNSKTGEVVVSARGLVKRYVQGGEERPVLDGLDLEVRAGEFTAVLGPSGSGKSTLLNLLGLMDHPTAGEIRLAGERTAGLGERRLAAMRNRLVGFVFQFDSLLPEFTVLENALMPARIGAQGSSAAAARRAEADAREIFAELGIAETADRFPSQISGGECQRAAIARALVNRPAVILADEPTGNLDRHNAELVFNKLKSLTDRLGVAVLLVTHNEEFAGAATRSLHLSDGRFAEGAKVPNHGA